VTVSPIGRSHLRSRRCPTIEATGEYGSGECSGQTQQKKSDNPFPHAKYYMPPAACGSSPADRLASVARAGGQEGGPGRRANGAIWDTGEELQEAHAGTAATHWDARICCLS